MFSYFFYTCSIFFTFFLFFFLLHLGKINSYFMGKTIKEKDQTIRYEEWVNKDTGEVRKFAVVIKPFSSDFNFHKVWLEDFARIIGILGGQKIAVFNHILGNINPYDNQFGGTIREIAEETESSTKTVQSVIKTLIQHDFMRKIRASQYQISPKFLVKGGHDKRMGLMLKYDDLDDGRQLTAFPPDEGLGEW